MKKIYLCVICLTAVLAFIASCDTAGDSKTTETGSYENVYEQEFQSGCLPSSAYIGGLDTFISSNLTVGFPSSPVMSVGRGEKNGLMFGLLKFNLTSIPKQAKVQNAVLVMYRNASYLSAASLRVDFLEVIKYNWNDTLTYDLWKSNGDTNRNAGSITIPSADTMNVYNITLNTSVIQNWIEKPEENFGLFLASNAGITGENYIDFASCEGNLPNRPILVIYYTL